MANIMLKSVKFGKVLNGRLLLTSVKPYIHDQYLVRSYTNAKQIKGYATAAYKLAENENSDMKKNNAVSSIIKKDMSIDKALAKIDSQIKYNGRTQIKNIHEIFSNITSKDITTSTHGLYLMRCCKYCYDVPSAERIQLVNQIWNKYQELGIEFDVRHYNALLDIHVSNHLDFNPAEILASIEDSNIEPNKATYLLVMKKFCQDGNISGASEILECMKEKGLSIDERVFNYLIEGHIKNKDFSGAEEMIEVMRSSNLEPTADTHTIFACGYAAIGNKDEMMNCLKKCDNMDNTQNYLKVIEALAVSGNGQHVDEVLSLIEHPEDYCHEFINTVVELIHKGCIDIAYKLAVATITPEYFEGLNIFLKQLMRGGRPASEVVDFAERILNEHHHQNVFFIVSKVATENGQLNYAVPVFKRMQGLGHVLRSKAFIPLFSSVKEKGGPWLVLKKMCELGVSCDFTTFIETVYPAMGVLHPDDVLQGVEKSGQAVETACDSLFMYYCSLGEIDYASRLIEIYPVKISDKFKVEQFVDLYSHLNKASIPKYYKLLKYILMGSSHIADHFVVHGRLLADLILRKPTLLQNLLETYADLKFNDEILRICEMEVARKNPPRQAFVRKIRMLSSERENLFQQENTSVEDENKYLDHLQAQGLSCRAFLVKRIQHHIRTKNIARVYELLSLFDEMKLIYPPLLLSNLIGMYCNMANLEKAKETVNLLASTSPHFQLDLSRSLDYVTLLIQYEKFDESLETLKNFLKEPQAHAYKDLVQKSVKKLCTVLINTGNIEFVKEIKKLLLPLSGELGFKSTLLRIPVDIYIKGNDIKSAMKEFRYSIEAHHKPASLNNLLRKCITSNENDMLQEAIDLTMRCNGKSYALLELAVAFIETYNVPKALKIVENLGEETDPKILDGICQTLWHKNKVHELEQLIFITRSLSHLNREDMYHYVFKAHADKKDFDKVLEMFEKLVEEVKVPQSDTIKFVQELFEKNGQPLPLSLLSNAQSEANSFTIEATKSFMEHLESGDADAALKELSKLKKGYIRTLSIKTLTDLIDLCLQKNCTHELSLNVQAMSYIIDNARDVLRPILEQYCNSGDVDKLIIISSFMPDFSLLSAGFKNYFCRAFLTCGKYEELLTQLEQRADKKTKLFSSIAFEELLKFPELEERIFNLAIKYLNNNYNLPMAVIWAYHFSKENYEKADEILKNFSFHFDKVDAIILKAIKENENIDLAKKYVDFVKTTASRSRTKERAYGYAVDLLVFKGMYDEAVALVLESEKENLLLHKYYISTLMTLKNVLEKENKPVPFTVPVEMESGSESSSDSE